MTNSNVNVFDQINSEVEKVNNEKATVTLKTKKKATDKKEKKETNSETKSKNLSDILSIGNNVLSSKTNKFGATLYKNELFAECVTDKEKKSLRIKLRRKLDAFFSEYVMNQNNKEKMLELKKAWLQYSNIVYIDANNIVDSNSSQDKQDIAKRFLAAMNK